MKRFQKILPAALALIIMPSAVAHAGGDSLKVLINDYSMIGVQYGVGLANPSFNPVRSSENLFCPTNVGIMYTHYCKMFGYMPYFGVRIGAFYTTEGYQFKKNETTGRTDCILGAKTTRYETIEVPLLSHFHVDFWKMKLMVDIGIYGGYRFNIKRTDYIYEYYHEIYKDYENAYHPNEYRFDYGIKGGGGVAFMFDPIEIHLMCYYKYAFQTLHQPNVNAISLEHDERSVYYYKWCYPTNLLFCVGVHYQLTRREGYTRKQLKMQALEEARQIYQEAQKKLEEQNKECLDSVSVNEPELSVPLKPQNDDTAPSDEYEERGQSVEYEGIVERKQPLEKADKIEMVDLKEIPNEKNNSESR